MFIKLVLASNNGALKFQVEIYTYDKISNLKEVLVPKEFLEKYGYDKLKLFQSGKHLDDNLVLSNLQSSEILIFPTSNYLREIIYEKYKNFNLEEKKDLTTANENIVVDATVKLPPISRQVSFATLEAPVEEITVEMPKPKMEEKVVLKSITQEELDKFNLETLNKFKSPTFRTLLQLYQNDETGVTDFLRYLTGGNIKAISTELVISDDLIREIQLTFPKAKFLSFEEIKLKLLEKGGNLNLLIQSGILL